MKNSLRYLKLWQKKRGELQIDDDPQADWMGMQSLLDQHMPVTATNAGDKPSRSKGFKLLSVFFVSLSAAAMTYVVSYVAETKSHKHNTHYHAAKHAAGFVNKNALDSTSKANVSDSLMVNDAAFTKADSLEATKQSSSIKSGGASDLRLDKKPLNILPGNVVPDKAAAASARNNGGPVTTQQNKNQVGGIGTKRLVQTSRVNVNANANANVKARPGNPFSAGSVKRSSLSGSNHRSLRPGSSRGAPDNKSVDKEKQQSLFFNSANNQREYPVISTMPPGPGFSLTINNGKAFGIQDLSRKVSQGPLGRQLQANKTVDKKGKSAKTKSAKASTLQPINLDWGILAGVNSSGSFTPKNQNANFYGSLPVDMFFGLFATYNVNNKWGINSQIQFLSPQNISGSYTHANGSKVDSNQTLTITDSRKAYFVRIPLNVVYKINSNLSFKAGPVISIPVKQINGNTLLQPAGIKADSAYYAKTILLLNGTKYDQKLNYGISAGASIRVKRFIFEATYLKSLGGYNVTSGFGSYKSSNGILQFTIGFQLNKPKP